jgi:hypothetical protein
LWFLHQCYSSYSIVGRFKEIALLFSSYVGVNKEGNAWRSLLIFKWIFCYTPCGYRDSNCTLDPFIQINYPHDTNKQHSMQFESLCVGDNLRHFGSWAPSCNEFGIYYCERN